MEIYSAEFPETTKNVIFKAKATEYSQIIKFLVEVKKESKRKKSIQSIIDIFTAAKEGSGLCELDNRKAQLLVECIDSYSDKKKKVANHAVHKYQWLFDLYLAIY